MTHVTPVREVRPDDVAALAGVLARALDDDPLFIALYPDSARRSRALIAMFGAWLRLLHLPRGAAWTTDDVAGGALWMPPGAWRIGLVDQIRLAPSVLGALGTRVFASPRALSAIGARHPA